MPDAPATEPSTPLKLYLSLAHTNAVTSDWVLAQAGFYMETLGFVTTDDPQDADATLVMSLEAVTDPLVPPESERILLQGTCRVHAGLDAKEELVLRSRVTSHTDLYEAQCSVMWQLSRSVWTHRGQLVRKKRPSKNGAGPIGSSAPKL